MIKSEYIRFLQSLISEEVTGDVRKIANIVLRHMETLIPLSTAQGQRIKKIVELAHKNWSATSSDIQPKEGQTEKKICPFTQIKSLSVGPFRGFAKREYFELASKLVLIYGPNGTGKSSFCEALEYSLLGNVAEAESKRFRNQKDYLKNAYTNNFAPPILMGVDYQENDFPIIADEAFYRFCFIEKNRIDNFSRITAQSPAKQTELISTLFGLDAFSDFVRNFTNSMDNYIDLDGDKQRELSKKQHILAGFKQNLETVPSDMEEIIKDENELANKYRSKCTFAQMVLELNGNESNEGLIAQLQSDIEKPIGTKSNLTISGLHELKQSIESLIIELRAKKKLLDKTSRELSYKQLYEAVIQLKESSIEKCPACHTPLSQVSVNPFQHAHDELKKLEYLVKLQDTIIILEKKTKILLTNLLQIIKICYSNFNKYNILEAYQTITEESVTIEWWDSLYQQFSDETIPWQCLESQVEKLEKTDHEINKTIANRTKKVMSLRDFERLLKISSNSKRAKIQ